MGHVVTGDGAGRREDVAEWAFDSATAQGKPPYVEDEATLDAVAALIAPELRRRG